MGHEEILTIQHYPWLSNQLALLRNASLKIPTDVSLSFSNETSFPPLMWEMEEMKELRLIVSDGDEDDYASIENVTPRAHYRNESPRPQCLNLNWFDFAIGTKYFLQALHTCVLRKLMLYHCEHIGHFLAEFIGDGRMVSAPLTWVSIVLHQELSNFEQKINSIETFFQSRKSLVEIDLELDQG